MFVNKDSKEWDDEGGPDWQITWTVRCGNPFAQPRAHINCHHDVKRSSAPNAIRFGMTTPTRKYCDGSYLGVKNTIFVVARRQYLELSLRIPSFIRYSDSVQITRIKSVRSVSISPNDQE